MHIGNLIAALALATAAAAHAEPVRQVIEVTLAAACIAQADAETLAKESSDAQQLFEALARKEGCRTYTGVVAIEKVIMEDDPYSVFEVTTLKDGTLYLIYKEQQGEPEVETAWMQRVQQGRR